jgi:hypothetical protein
MPEGEWSFLESKGPRRLLQLRLTPQADAFLRIRAAETGTSKNALATDLVESYVAGELAKTGEPS